MSPEEQLLQFFQDEAPAARFSVSIHELELDFSLDRDVVRNALGNLEAQGHIKHKEYVGGKIEITFYGFGHS